MAEKLPDYGKYPHEAGSGDLVRMKLVSGHTEYLAKRTLVGFCHNSLHRGGLTKKLMEEHGCLEKECTFFQKYLDRPYWQEQKSHKKKRAAAKAKKRAAREERQAAKEQLSLAKEKMRSLVTDEPFEIINVERLEPHTYTVFYVSDNPFADGNRFPVFLAAAKESFPGYRIMLRHIDLKMSSERQSQTILKSTIRDGPTPHCNTRHRSRWRPNFKAKQGNSQTRNTTTGVRK